MTSPDHSKGVMVALYPSAEAAERLAIDHENAADPEGMHVTLAYVGDKGDEGVPDQEDWPELQDAVREVAKRHAPVEADVTGTCRFTPGDDGTPFVGVVGSHTIHQVRQDLVNQLKGRGIPVKENFAFVPHTTLTYLGDGEDTPQGIDEPVPMELSPHLVVEYGEQATHHPFGKEAPKSEPKEARNGSAGDDTWAAFRIGQRKEGKLYYRDEGLNTFHISDEDKSGQTICGQPLPHGDIYVETPPRKDICRVCTLFHDRELAQQMKDFRADEVADQKAEYAEYKPPSFDDKHQPDHEYVGNIAEIGYYIAGCKCGWASNVRSEQAANNAWQRHYDTLDEAGRREKAGEPSYVHPSPKTKRWGSVRLAAVSYKTRLNQTNSLAKEYGDDPAEVVHQFDDGWSIRKMADEDKWREGYLMKHCWDGQDGGVWMEQGAGYSLRDENNVPHVSFYHDKMANTDDSGRGHDNKRVSWGMYGFKNSKPKPEYAARIHEWHQSLPYKTYGRPFNTGWEGQLFGVEVPPGGQEALTKRPGERAPEQRERYRTWLHKNAVTKKPFSQMELQSEDGESKVASVDDDYFDSPEHDYDPNWDYEEDESPHPDVVAAVEKARPLVEETARHIGLGRPSIHYIRGGKGIATYAHGTAPHPVLMVDGNQHREHAADELDWGVHTSLFHELGHGVEDWMERDYNEDAVEDFARKTWGGNHIAAADEYMSQYDDYDPQHKEASWVDQVSRPYSDGAIAEPDEGQEPVMPPLYEGGFGVWPDDIPEDPTRTVHPVDIFSGPRTGWKQVIEK